ncbi:MAG: hypothetical protein QXG80_02550 [Nanopusillaceae archaeon]
MHLGIETTQENLFNERGLAKLSQPEEKKKLDQQDKFIRTDNQHREKSKRGLLGLLILGLVIASGLLYYYYGYLLEVGIHTQKERAERIEKLKNVGLDLKTAEEFDNLFNRFYPYNSTIYEFAKYFKENKELALKTFEIFKNFKSSNEFLSIAINKPNSLEFLKRYEDLVRNLYIGDLKYALELYSKNSTLFDIIYNNIKNDEKLTDLIAKTIIISKYGDIIPFNIEYEIRYNKPIEQAKRIKTELIPFTSKLFLDLNYIDKVKVLDLNSNDYKEVPINKDLINVVGNYSAAVYALKLPMHDKQSIYLLGNATLINPEIVDFEPIILKDVRNKTFIIGSGNIPRENWMLVEFLKRRPYVIKEPEKFEWINAVITQLAWKIFDDIMQGPAYFNRVGIRDNVYLIRIFKPTDENAWEVILKFYDYMDNLPKELREKGIEPLYYYFDSNKLKEQFPNKVDRKIVLYILANIPHATWNIDEGQPIVGIEGMKKFVEQLPILRDAIINLYKQAKVDESKLYKEYIEERRLTGYWSVEYLKVIEGILTREYEIARYGYWQWISDRGNNGLFNTALLYTEFDKFLKENWDKWDLIRFIKGATRYEYYTLNIPGFLLDEGETYTYGYDLTFKSFGIPLSWIGGRPYIFGTSAAEWAVPLPTNIAEKLKERFRDRIVLAPGNFISLYSAVGGAEKDGIREVNTGINLGNNYGINLWKKN